MDDAVRMQIESLGKLKTTELRARYFELFGEASGSSNRAHLFRRIAWRLQAQAEGDLGERARQRAAELANDLDLRLRAPRSFWREIECNGEIPIAIRDCRRLVWSSSVSIKARSFESQSWEAALSTRASIMPRSARLLTA